MIALDSKAEINGIAFDSAIAAYITDPSRTFDVESIAAGYLGIYINEEQTAQLSLLDDTEESDRPGK